MARVANRVRDQALRRARRRCEYCQAQQFFIVSLHIDHIIPRAAGGGSALDNLCAACALCNGFKRDFVSGIDPATGMAEPLFHPRQDDWESHFRWSDNGLRIIGLTATGRATVSRLNMNSGDLVEAREVWITTGVHPPLQNS